MVQMRRVPFVGAMVLLVVLVAGSPVAGAPRGPVSVREPADIDTAQRVDFNGDVYSDLAVGAPGENIGVGISNGGAVNVLYGSAGGLVADDQVFLQGSLGVGGTPESGDEFGVALAKGVYYNDFDADGFTDLAVGAPGENVGTGNTAGAVNLLNGSAGGLDGSSLVLFQGADLGGGASVGGSAEPGDVFGAAVD